MKVAVLLVNSFFCTFPRRNVSSLNAQLKHKNACTEEEEFSSYPLINFNELFSLTKEKLIEAGRGEGRLMACLHKLKCILDYFSQVVPHHNPAAHQI